MSRYALTGNTHDQSARQDAEQDGPPAQVTVNWVIAKGALPIPGAKNARQAESNLGALTWSLTAGEVAALDEVSGRMGKLVSGTP